MTLSVPTWYVLSLRHNNVVRDVHLLLFLEQTTLVVLEFRYDRG